jgi:hypothetical protein
MLWAIAEDYRAETEATEALRILCVDPRNPLRPSAWKDFVAPETRKT